MRRSPRCSAWPPVPRSPSCIGHEWHCDSISHAEGEIMSDQWMDRLSEYLDDELAEGERIAVEAHLQSCDECSAVLADLRQVVARARVLESRAPTVDLWP